MRAVKRNGSVNLCESTPRIISPQIILHLISGYYMALIWSALLVINVALWIMLFVSGGTDSQSGDKFTVFLGFVLAIPALLIKPVSRRRKIYHLLKHGKLTTGTILSQKPYTGDVSAVEGMSMTEYYRSVEVTFSIGGKEYEFVQHTKTRRDDLLDLENCIVLFDPQHHAQALAFFPGYKKDEFFAVDEHTIGLDCWPIYALLIPLSVFILMNMSFLVLWLIR